MPLKPLAFRELKRKLESAGFTKVSQRGSHVKFAKRKTNRTLIVIVPEHSEIAVGTLRSILRQAGLTPHEFETL